MSSATANTGDSGSPSEAVRVEYDDDTPPSLAVVAGLAELAGVEAVDLADETGIVLFDHVDPDALDALVDGHTETGVRVSFTVTEYEVEVTDTDAVVRRLVE